MDYKNVPVKEERWRKLNILKYNNGKRSLDEVVSMLIKLYEEKNGKTGKKK